MIKNSWNIIDIEQKGIVDEKEFSYLMRHLHQFPDEAHVQDLIEEEVRGDDLAGLSLSKQISFEQFEKFMLKHLQAEDPDLMDRFKPDTFNDMMEAFKMLDPMGKGYLRRDVLTHLL